MESIKKILKNKYLGVVALSIAFVLFVCAWFFLPKIITGVVRYQKELARATVPVNLSLEEKKKSEKEILEIQNSIRSSDKKGADNYASQYVLLGEKLEKLGYRAKAVRAYKNAIREDATFVEAHGHLGSVSRMMEDYTTARDEFRIAIDLNPVNVTLYPKLAQVYLEGLKDPAVARGVYIEGLVQTHNDLRLIKEYVPFLEKIGESLEAASYRQEILKKEPKK